MTSTPPLLPPVPPISNLPPYEEEKADEINERKKEEPEEEIITDDVTSGDESQSLTKIEPMNEDTNNKSESEDENTEIRLDEKGSGIESPAPQENSNGSSAVPTLTGPHYPRQLFPLRNSPFHPGSGLTTNSAAGAPTFLPSESVYESAAKLLFMSIKWARSVPSFLQLSETDQTLLLEDSWAQLFVVGLAQWSIHFDEALLVRDSLVTPEEQNKLLADAKQLKDVTGKLTHLRLDHTEFTCLKALSLFKPDVQGLRNNLQVELLQDQTHLMLQEYCHSKGHLATGKLRFGKILLSLPIISQVNIYNEKTS